METTSRGAVPFINRNMCRNCPVCHQNLHLYYVNYEELFLMCENKSCEFPFGFEPIQLVNEESQLVADPPKATNEFYEYPFGGVNGVKPLPVLTIDARTFTTNTEDSTLASSCLSDCDQQSVNGDTDVHSELMSVRLHAEGKKRKQREVRDKEIEKSLRGLKKLSDEMYNLETNVKQIKNTRWLNNLKIWERTSGQKLLRDEEKTLLKMNEPDFALGELKISVDPEGKIPSLDIQITSPPYKEEPGI